MYGLINTKRSPEHRLEIKEPSKITLAIRL